MESPAETTQDVTVVDVLEEKKESDTYGKYTGSTKWFNDKLGYGFITICDGDEKGKDIFVHHSGVKPLNSNYKTLRKGEYIQFNIVNGMNGLQAIDVTGIKGGPLMCDYVTNKHVLPVPESQPRDPQNEWTTIVRKVPYKVGSVTEPPPPPPPHKKQFVPKKPLGKAKYNKQS